VSTLQEKEVSVNEDIIPKTLTIDFSQLSESIQQFHLNTAKNSEVSLEEHLIDFIKLHTEKEQEQIEKELKACAEELEATLKQSGFNGNIPTAALDPHYNPEYDPTVPEDDD
jgi:hypothetical protein